MGLLRSVCQNQWLKSEQLGSRQPGPGTEIRIQFQIKVLDPGSIPSLGRSTHGPTHPSPSPTPFSLLSPIQPPAPAELGQPYQGAAGTREHCGEASAYLCAGQPSSKVVANVLCSTGLAQRTSAGPLSTQDCALMRCFVRCS